MDGKAKEFYCNGTQEISVQRQMWGPTKALWKVEFIIECSDATNLTKNEKMMI